MPTIQPGELITCVILVPGAPRRIDYRLAADIAPFEVFRINNRRDPTPPPKRGRPRKSA